MRVFLVPCLFPLFSVDSRRSVSNRLTGTHHDENEMNRLRRRCSTSGPQCLYLVVVGTLLLSIAACGTGRDDPANLLPTADAGPDQSVKEETEVTLSAAGSQDPDGTITTFRWTQIGGSPVTLNNSSEAESTFDAPELFKTETLEFRLDVTDQRGGTASDTVKIVVDPDPPDQDKFLTFLNPLPELRPTLYTATAATFNPGAVGQFVLRIEENGIETARHQGEWQSSAGRDPFGEGNRFRFMVSKPAEVRVTLESPTVDTYLYVNQEETRFVGPRRVLRENDDGVPGSTNSQLIFASSTLNNIETAKAYYRAVDPNNQRTTLQDWKALAGFDQGTDAHAIYRNAADLGFARNMFFRRNGAGTVASYVENYRTIEDAIAGRNILATVAMEFGPGPTGGHNYTKFFTFGADGQRLLSVDLDGRGEKFVPAVCNVCHGGTPKPAERDTAGNMVYPADGDTDAQFLPWDIDSFEFSQTDPRFSRANQEGEFKKLNALALSTLPIAGIQTKGRWTGRAARELIEGWYGGPGMPQDTFNGNFVPPGWLPPQAPNGVAELYLKVVAPSCRACHLQRGRLEESKIDFSTYAGFIAYSDSIESLVYDRGLMPLARLTYDRFWRDATGSKQAAILAANLPNFSRRAANGDPLRPGRPLAIVGPNLLLSESAIPPPGIFLAGAGSLFFDAVNWRVVERPFLSLENGSFDNENQFVLASCGITCTIYHEDSMEPGIYGFELTVSNARGESDSAIVRYAVERFTPFTRYFADDVRPILQQDCGGCHMPGGSGAFAFLLDEQDLFGDLFRVLDRADVLMPLASKIIRKPSGEAHGGGARTGWDFRNVHDPSASTGDGRRVAVLLRWLHHDLRQ